MKIILTIKRVSQNTAKKMTLGQVAIHFLRKKLFDPLLSHDIK